MKVAKIERNSGADLKPPQNQLFYVPAFCFIFDAFFCSYFLLIIILICVTLCLLNQMTQWRDQFISDSNFYNFQPL